MQATETLAEDFTSGTSIVRPAGRSVAQTVSTCPAGMESSPYRHLEMAADRQAVPSDPRYKQKPVTTGSKTRDYKV